MIEWPRYENRDANKCSKGLMGLYKCEVGFVLNV